MKATGFVLQETTHKETSEVMNRIMVQFEDDSMLKLFLKGEKCSDVVSTIKADRQLALNSIIVLTGEFGQYAMISGAKTLEVF